MFTVFYFKLSLLLDILQSSGGNAGRLQKLNRCRKKYQISTRDKDMWMTVNA